MNKLMQVFFKWVCPVIDHEFHHHNGQRTVAMDLQATL